MASPLIKVEQDPTLIFKPLPTDSMPDSRVIVNEREFQVNSELMKRHSRHCRDILSSEAEVKDQYRVFKFDINITARELAFACDIWNEHFIGQETTRAERFPRWEEDAAAFEIILCAIHSQPYELSSTLNIDLSIRLAYAYKALPILSSSLDVPFLNSDNLVHELPKNALYLLPLAATLRNKTLFKECLLHTLGPFNSPQFRQLQDPKLRIVAERAYNQMCAKIAEAQTELLSLSTGAGYNIFRKVFSEDIKVTMHEAAGNSMVDGHFSLPVYFRTLEKYKGPGGPKIRRVVEPVLRDNLVLRDENRLPGDGGYADFLFCADIRDEDLPWDSKQTVW